MSKSKVITGCVAMLLALSMSTAAEANQTSVSGNKSCSSGQGVSMYTESTGTTRHYRGATLVATYAISGYARKTTGLGVQSATWKATSTVNISQAGAFCGGI